MKFLIAVPVFNEERYADSVMRQIRKYARVAALTHGVEMRVLVVDDGSTDGTPGLLAEMAAKGHIDVLTHPENRGYGQSLIDAFNFAAARGYDWVITMDCDEQHEPCRIPLFVAEAMKDDADVISGSRYLRVNGNGDSVPPADRRNINRIITELLNSALRLNVLEAAGREDRQDADATGDGSVDTAAVGLTDAFCGFKAHRVSAMQRMHLTIPGYAFPMQFWVQAASLGLVIREIPVKLIYKDASRHFGGMLDDPTVRLQHYLEEFAAETRAVREGESEVCVGNACERERGCAFHDD